MKVMLFSQEISHSKKSKKRVTVRGVSKHKSHSKHKRVTRVSKYKRVTVRGVSKPMKVMLFSHEMRHSERSMNNTDLTACTKSI